jgi:hypothetical protein
MKLNHAIVLLGIAAAVGSSAVVTAQVNCETIPAGPARTDCNIGLSRISGQKAGVAAGVARQQANRATYRNVTGKNPSKKIRHAIPARDKRVPR